VDDFQALRMKIKKADALVFSTPVYCHDLSESAKRFLDRLRRCEIFSDRNTCKGTKAIGIAAAGGSGNGTIRTLFSLEDYFKRVGLEIFDLVPVTRYTKQHKLPMLTEAGRNLIALILEQIDRKKSKESRLI
jgi:multimeric flavodoxin WrbA